MPETLRSTAFCSLGRAPRARGPDSRGSLLIAGALILAGVALVAPLDATTLASAGSAAALQTPAPADSAAIHREARRAQDQFERYRVSQTPARAPRRGGGQMCWDRVGTYCLSGGGQWEPEPVPRSVIDARRQLIELLEGWAEAIPGDGWITGQRVRYLLEAEDDLWASEVADDCLASGAWCDLLLGWVEHERGNWIDAGRFFLDAIEAMTPEERAALEVERWLTDRTAQGFLFVDDPAEREGRRALFWRLADPLYLVPGNARWTEHMSRITRNRILGDSENHLMRPWNESLQQIELRHGLDVKLERERQPVSLRMPNIEDPEITGFLSRSLHEYLPSGETLASFPVTAEGALAVRGRRSTTGYTAPFARSIENLSSQTGRFLRDGELLVVHRAARFPPVAEDEDEDPDSDPFDPLAGRVEAGAGAGAGWRGEEGLEPFPSDLRTALFLLPVAGPVIEEGPEPALQGEELEGLWSARVPRGDFILSLEGWSRFEARAWRVRHGVPDLPRSEGLLAASDPIFLDAGPEEEPATLEEALETMLPTTRFRAGELVRIGWEVYGIPEGEIASVSLGVEQAEQSALRRLGEFFRVVDPLEPVTIRWDDAAAEDPDRVFRVIELQLPSLDPGTYDLFLEIRMDEEPPAVARRRLHIIEA